MTQQFTVEPQQLRRHVARLEALADRFGAVKGASASIAQDPSAYGRLCGWIAGVLEERHARQNELIAYVEENLRLAARAVRQASEAYEAADLNAAQRLQRAARSRTG